MDLGKLCKVIISLKKKYDTCEASAVLLQEMKWAIF